MNTIFIPISDNGLDGPVPIWAMFVLALIVLPIGVMLAVMVWEMWSQRSDFVDAVMCWCLGVIALLFFAFGLYFLGAALYHLLHFLL